jgi:gliding motility-associated-like protein
MPVGYGISQINLDVYNRWGSKIFKGNNETVGWDGKLNGKICEQGTYIYKIEIITVSGVSHNKTGHLVLLDSNRRQ